MSATPIVDPHEAERRLYEETATATDILSQIISESLLGTCQQPTAAFDDEVNKSKYCVYYIQITSV